MTSFIRMTLSGDSLGERHRHLNSLVDEAHKQEVPFGAIQTLPDLSPIDRLFKIDLASKYRHVEYIVHSLKDGDMLYVSRALKSTWLLDTEYNSIMNPHHLETKLYPEMTATAVYKMKRWISLNLRDPQRSQQFFEYYIAKSFNDAVKFLWRCSNDFILSRATDILDELTPHQLKLLSEKCPEVAKVYFDSLQSNERVVTMYLKKETEYYDNLKCLLKINADIFLDITEKYFNQYEFRHFSSEATKYVMSNYRKRFDDKPELYTAWLLDMNTLAKCLHPDEAKDLLLRLARAKYLSNWFSYKTVEPLIKRLNIDERTALKKQVFVDKSFGDVVEEWPYKTPSIPEEKSTATNIFEDQNHDPCEYEEQEMCFRSFPRNKKMKCKKRKMMGDYCVMETQSALDQLFDRYRFTSFEKTLAELRRKMMVETLQNRQNMMLVLISKSGGRPESVEELLTLLTDRHDNEPVHLRATIVRSLVKRCSAWRLPQTPWNLMLRFGRDLGLDGAPPAVPCLEGVHAAVLRSVINDYECDPAVWKAFLKEFSTLKEYSLTPSERRAVLIKLPALLLADAELDPGSCRFNQLLDTLDAYDIRADRCPGVLSAVVKAAQSPDAEPLLQRLFNSRIARKELFKENFSIIQTGPSYFNALKHDINILSADKFEALLDSDHVRLERFLRALSLYFGEEQGLADTYLDVLEKKAAETPNSKLARPLALLAGMKIIPLIQKLDESPKHSPSQRLGSALRANAHLSRPAIDLDTIGWQLIGAKAVANRVLNYSAVNIDAAIDKLLTWKRTERLALVLSMRVSKEYSVGATVAAKRPRLALKAALWHLRRKNALDARLWDIIIPLIAKLDVSGRPNERLRERIGDVSVVPLHRKAEYCTMLFDVLKKISTNAAMPALCNLEIILPDVDGRFTGMVIKDFLDNDLSAGNVSKPEYEFNKRASLYVRIIAKYLLLSKTEATQKFRFENVGRQFFGCLETIWKSVEDKSNVTDLLDNFILALRYTKVFLSPDYVSCIPIFEKVILWMQKFLPVELYFSKYVRLHLTMLYFKSIKQGMKNNVEIFKDLKTNVNEAVEIVGITFGKYISHETKELKAKYFDSIVDLYKTELVAYLNTFPPCDDTKALLIVCILKGILRSESSTHLLAQQVYSENEFLITDYVGDQIKDLLRQSQSQEVKFFFHAE